MRSVLKPPTRPNQSVPEPRLRLTATATATAVDNISAFHTACPRQAHRSRRLIQAPTITCAPIGVARYSPSWLTEKRVRTAITTSPIPPSIPRRKDELEPRRQHIGHRVEEEGCFQKRQIRRGKTHLARKYLSVFLTATADMELEQPQR